MGVGDGLPSELEAAGGGGGQLSVATDRLSPQRAMTISTSLGAFCKISRASCNPTPRNRHPLTLIISSPICSRPSLKDNTSSLDRYIYTLMIGGV